MQDEVLASRMVETSSCDAHFAGFLYHVRLAAALACNADSTYNNIPKQAGFLAVVQLKYMTSKHEVSNKDLLLAPDDMCILSLGCNANSIVSVSPHWAGCARNVKNVKHCERNTAQRYHDTSKAPTLKLTINLKQLPQRSL